MSRKSRASLTARPKAGPIWPCSRSWRFRGIRRKISCSIRRAAANTVFADGSVRFLSASIKSEVFVFLVTRRGGEVVSGSDY